MNADTIVNSLALTDTWADGIGPVGTLVGGIVRIPFYAVRHDRRLLSASLTMPSHAFRQWVGVAATQHYAAMRMEPWRTESLHS